MNMIVLQKVISFVPFYSIIIWLIRNRCGGGRLAYEKPMARMLLQDGNILETIRKQHAHVVALELEKMRAVARQQPQKIQFRSEITPFCVVSANKDDDDDDNDNASASQPNFICPYNNQQLFDVIV